LVTMWCDAREVPSQLYAKAVAVATGTKGPSTVVAVTRRTTDQIRIARERNAMLIGESIIAEL